MHDRSKIRALRASGASLRAIAAEMGVSTGAVRRALAPDAHRGRRDSMRARFEPAIRDVLADAPRTTVEHVARLIDWPGSMRWLAVIVADLRPAAFERERQGLRRPSVGTVKVGTVELGTVKLGTVQLGRAVVGSARLGAR